MNRRFLLAGFCVWMVLGCGSRQQSALPPAPVPQEPERVRLVAVGDILMHFDVKRVAQRTGSFEPLWSDVEPLFQRADIVFGNLETPVAPLTGKRGVPYIFNAPIELPGDLKRSGFTILSTANNHAYDQGTQGQLETQTHLESDGLAFIGSGKDKASAMTPRILESHGIRIAFLAWTDLFNIDFNREGKSPWVNHLVEEEACVAVRAARQQADAVIVSIHWGVEDHHVPTDRQREVAAKLFEAGADLILGHHPHVLQPLETQEQNGRKVAVAYSLGNFISNQNRTYASERMSLVQGDERDGAAVVATFVRKAPDRVELEKIGYVPLWTENNWWQMKTGGASQREIQVVRLDEADHQGEPYALRRTRIHEMMAPGEEIEPRVN